MAITLTLLAGAKNKEARGRRRKTCCVDGYHGRNAETRRGREGNVKAPQGSYFLL